MSIPSAIAFRRMSFAQGPADDRLVLAQVMA